MPPTLTPAAPTGRAGQLDRPTPDSLAPLSAAETVTAVRVLRAELALPASARLVAIGLHRTSSQIGAARGPDEVGDRDALVVVEDREIGAAYEAVVAVDDGFVRAVRRADRSSRGG